MNLSAWWERVSRPWLLKILDMARRDPDVSLVEYQDLKRQYDNMYKQRDVKVTQKTTPT